MTNYFDRLQPGCPEMRPASKAANNHLDDIITAGRQKNWPQYYASQIKYLFDFIRHEQVTREAEERMHQTLENLKIQMNIATQIARRTYTR